MDILTIVGQYAFPVVACIACGWYVKDQGEKNREQLDKISNTHRDEMKEVTTALHNNTLAIQKLCDYVERSERNG